MSIEQIGPKTIIIGAFALISTCFGYLYSIQHKQNELLQKEVKDLEAKVIALQAQASSQEPMFIRDYSGVIVSVNYGAMNKLFRPLGYAHPNEIIGKHLNELDKLDKKFIQALNKVHLKLLKNPSNAIIAQNIKVTDKLSIGIYKSTYIDPLNIEYFKTQIAVH